VVCLQARALEWDEQASGGGNGVAVTTANSTLTGIPTGASMTFSTEGSTAPSGTRYFRVAGDGVNGRIAGRTGVVRTVGNITYYRFYFRCSAPGAVDIWRLFDNVGGVPRVRLDLNSSGQLNVRDANTTRYTTTKVFLPNEWHRIEVSVNTINDTLRLRLYWGSQLHDAGSSGAEYEEATGLTWTDNVFDEIRFGSVTPLNANFDFDALAWTDGGTGAGAWIGPDTVNPNEATRLANGSLAVAMSNTATGDVVPASGATVNGDGSLAVAFSDTATAVAERNGSGTLATALANTAAGQRAASTTASLAVSLANSSSGALTKAQTAALAVALANTATGAVTRNGSATLAVAFSDSADRSLSTGTSATLAITLADTASGSVGSVASLAVGLSNTATGAVTRSGSATLAVAFSDTSTGLLTRAGTATLAVGLSNTAAAAGDADATASLAVAFAPSATGQIVKTGTASLTVTFADTATAEHVAETSADLTVDVILAAAGQVPGAAVPAVGQLWPRGGA
jgi:hypothetical protein